MVGILNYAPIYFLAFFSIVSFYFFYVISSFNSLIHIYSAIISGLIIIIGIALKKTLKLNKLYTIILFSLVGIFLGSIAFYKLIIFYSPIKTLAENEKIKTITAELTGEPIPFGRKYYCADAKILSCHYDNADFSARGNIRVYIPIEMLAQNNAFSVSSYKIRPNSCKTFSKGLIFSAKGRLNHKKEITQATSFFVDSEIPSFIGWKSSFSQIRASLRFYLMRLLAGWKEAGGLLLALLSANKDFLSKNCVSLFRQSGLAHILALSGMHVSLIALIAMQMGKIFGKKSTAIKISLLAIIVFVWFAGSAPSLNRAMGMMIILLIGKYLGLQPKMLSVLSCMLVIHLGLKPIDALSLGFMLSYGALAGIIILGESVYSIFIGKIPPKILGGISASIGAQLFTAPIVISKIGIIAPIGIIASIVVSPIVSFFLILGLISVFISLIFPFTGFIFSFLLNKIYSIIIIITNFFAVFPQIIAKAVETKILFSIISIIIGVALLIYSKLLKEKKLWIY